MCAECSGAKFEVWIQSAPQILMVCSSTWGIAHIGPGETQLRKTWIVVFSMSALFFSSARCSLYWAQKLHQNNTKWTGKWENKKKEEK